jgi:hypothetical protein
MRTADTFARFVDLLADTLDDRDLSGEALAARARLADSGPAFLAQVRAIVEEGHLTKPSWTPSAIRPRSSPTVE